LKNPRSSATIAGHIALADVQKLADVPLDVSGGGLPSVIQVSGTAGIAPERITVVTLFVAIAGSDLRRLPMSDYPR